MGEVIQFPVPEWTKNPIQPDTVLEEAKGKLEKVLVIAIAIDGTVYAATSHPDKRDWIYLCQQFQHKLFNGDFG